MQISGFRKVLSYFVIGLFLAGSAMCADQSEASRAPSGPESALRELPRCSAVRRKMEQGIYGSGIEAPYMANMRRAGVKRAFYEIHAIWKHHSPTRLHIVRRLFFNQVDGPGAEITEPAELSKLKQQGLVAILDRVAIEQVKGAPLYGGMHGVKHPEGKKMYSQVEFFADPWIPHHRTVLSPLGRSDPLLHAVYAGDLSGVQQALQAANTSPAKLNKALLAAGTTLYDNTQVIKLLVQEGADINFHGGHGVTPLINAVPQPCNVRALLALGARVNETDKWGRTALYYAERGKLDESARLLRASASQK